MKKYESSPGYIMRTGLKKSNSNKTTPRKKKKCFPPPLANSCETEGSVKAYNSSVPDQWINIFTANKFQSWGKKSSLERIKNR